MSARPKKALTTAVDETDPAATSSTSLDTFIDVSRENSGSSRFPGMPTALLVSAPAPSADITGCLQTWLAFRSDSCLCWRASCAMSCHVLDFACLRLFLRGGITAGMIAAHLFALPILSINFRLSVCNRLVDRHRCSLGSWSFGAVAAW